MSFFAFSRSIGPVFIDVVLSEKAGASMEIPAHPVERGAKISDHAWRLPKVLELECLTEDMTGTWGALNALMEEAEPFDVLSGFDLFPNMMIESIEPQRDAAFSSILYASVRLKEVIIVSSHAGGGFASGGMPGLDSGIGAGGGIGSLDIADAALGLAADPRGFALAVRGQVQALAVDTATSAGRAIAARMPLPI